MRTRTYINGQISLVVAADTGGNSAGHLDLGRFGRAATLSKYIGNPECIIGRQRGKMSDAEESTVPWAFRGYRSALPYRRRLV